MWNVHWLGLAGWAGLGALVQGCAQRGVSLRVSWSSASKGHRSGCVRRMTRSLVASPVARAVDWWL